MQFIQPQSQKNKYKILLCVTGSVATIKLKQLIEILHQSCHLRVITTQSSLLFITKQEIAQLKQSFQVEFYNDEDEKQCWSKRGDPVLHIELRRWADALLMAPLSANTLAKITNGICDNLVSLVCRCWDMKKRSELKSYIESQEGKDQLIKPMIIAPAMNTMMWEHPITNTQINQLKNWGCKIIDTVQKTLICGDSGKGAMADLQTIKNTLFKELQLSLPNKQ